LKFRVFVNNTEKLPDLLAGRVAPRRGRPRKFNRPSRAVTLTLPEDVIHALESIDADLSRAVVRIAQPHMKTRPHAPAELATFGGHAVIVVTPTPTLGKRTGVLLVPLSDGRALIAFDTMTPAHLELVIRDELEDQALPEADARVFKAIWQLLRDARRSTSVTLRQRNIIVIEYAHGGSKHA
jgi:hypothetical protein